MLAKSGLYYPFIHIRNETWLKAAAFYWKRLDRIVPHSYPTQDSPTVRLLSDELGFVVNRHPHRAAAEASTLFLDLITSSHGTAIAKKLAIQPSFDLLHRNHGHPIRTDISDQGTVGYIYADKFKRPLIEALEAEGLAFSTISTPQDRRSSMRAMEANWIGMDRRLAAVYMTVLARLIAQYHDLNPVTDDALAHVAMDGLTVEDIARILIDQQSPPTNDLNHLHERVALLAVQSVVPRGLGFIDASQIVAFRRGHEDALTHFQSAVATAANELANLPEDTDSQTLTERVIETTNMHLLEPRNELKRALRLFGFETMHSALTLQLPVSAGVGTMVGGATTPVFGATTAAACTLLAFGSSERRRRSELRRRSGAANYLLELQADLTPKGVLRRRLKSFTPTE